MITQKERQFCRFTEKEKEFSKSLHLWIAQYEEEDDFLCGKVANLLPGFSEEE